MVCYCRLTDCDKCTTLVGRGVGVGWVLIMQKMMPVIGAFLAGILADFLLETMQSFEEHYGAEDYGPISLR